MKGCEVMNGIENKFAKFSNRLDKTLGIKIFALISSVLPLLFYVNSFMFSINCQNLYGIPSKYFSITMHDIMPYAILFFFIVVAFIYNYFFYKNNNLGNNLSSKIFYLNGAIVPGLVFSIIEFTLFYIFSLKFNWIENFLTPLFVTVIYIVMLIVSTFSFVKIPDSISGHLKLKKRIKKSTVFFSVIIYASITISYIFLFFNATPISKSYETTTINNNKYVILSEYESDYLVVKYDDTNETTIFFTSEYQLVNKENLNIKPLSFPNIEYK